MPSIKLLTAKSAVLPKAKPAAKPPKPVQPAMCSSCPFRTDGRAIDLAPGRLAEIQVSLIHAKTHECHHDALHSRPERHMACRGGRDYQLTIWHRLGLIAEPTDAALGRYLVSIGVWTAPAALCALPAETDASTLKTEAVL